MFKTKEERLKECATITTYLKRTIFGSILIGILFILAGYLFDFKFFSMAMGFFALVVTTFLVLGLLSTESPSVYTRERMKELMGYYIRAYHPEIKEFVVNEETQTILIQVGKNEVEELNIDIIEERTRLLVIRMEGEFDILNQKEVEDKMVNNRKTHKGTLNKIEKLKEVSPEEKLEIKQLAKKIETESEIEQFYNLKKKTIQQNVNNKGKKLYI